MHRIPPVLDDALGFNLYRVALLFRQELMTALSDYGLTPEQWQVLQALWSTEGDLNQSEVAHLTLRDRHTASRIITRLERDGWIEKHPDPEDGRAYLVRLTAKAEALRQDVPQELFAHFEDLLDVLEDGEEAHLLRLLKKLRRRLESDR